MVKGRPIKAIATDYDGTLATDGTVEASTTEALQRYQAAGGSLILVTGRRLPELLAICPQIGLFQAVVAENGAVIYWPERQETQLLSPPLPEVFVKELQSRQVSPIELGQVIVATWEPYGETVANVIQDLGLAVDVILNKRAVMVLPAGVDKASGLAQVLAALGLPAEQVAAIGDAENDQALLQNCGLGVAVANALPSLKAVADRVTKAERGAGVQELIDWLLSDSL